MIQVVTFKWKPPTGYRSTFNSSHVNRLARMVAKHYQKPHEFVCVTDDAEGIDLKSVRVVPLWDDFASIPSPEGVRNPSCYRRLKLFSEASEVLIGKRFVSLDLDCVVTGDLSPAFDRPEDFVIWGKTNPQNPYNGSMMLMNSGARSQVWTDFDPEKSTMIAKKNGFFGSDQAWISYKLGPNEATFSKDDGVFSYRNDIRPISGKPLPKNASIVFFHGHIDPWSTEPQTLSWVREHWNQA